MKPPFQKVLMKNVAMFAYIRALRVETHLSIDKCIESYVRELGNEDDSIESMKMTYQRMQKLFLTTSKEDLF